MNFEYSDKTVGLIAQLEDFITTHIIPIEKVYTEFLERPENLWVVPDMLAGLQEKARQAGLWNVFFTGGIRRL